MAQNKFKIEVERRYFTSKVYEVDADTAEEAKLVAEGLSGREDHSGNLSLEDVESTVLEFNGEAAHLLDEIP